VDRNKIKRLRLIIALALFLGWMGYLGYAAITKSRSPVVSHIQAAAATFGIVADVNTDQDGKPSKKVRIIEVLYAQPAGGTLAAGTECEVMNLQDVRGFEGKGQYLLLLVPDQDSSRNPGDPGPLPRYKLVEQQRSPGSFVTEEGKPEIYRWNDDVRKQYEKLHR
jgi:hypothetical protein